MDSGRTMGDDTEMSSEQEALRSHQQLSASSPPANHYERSRNGVAKHRSSLRNNNGPQGMIPDLHDTAHSRNSNLSRHSDVIQDGDTSASADISRQANYSKYYATPRSFHSNSSHENNSRDINRDTPRHSTSLSSKYRNDYSSHRPTAKGSPVVRSVHDSMLKSINVPRSRRGSNNSFERSREPILEDGIAILRSEDPDPSRRVSEAIKRINSANQSFHSENSAKRRKPTKLNEESSSIGNIPPLLLDIDLDDLDHEEVSIHENGQSLKFSDNTTGTTNLDDSTRINLSTDKSNEAYYLAENTVTELQMALKTKDQEIKALKATIADISRVHENDMEKSKTDSHREYSREAAEKIKELYKKLEAKAHAKSERQYSAEIASLKNQILIEREEKSELVKACDMYLHLQGF